MHDFFLAISGTFFEEPLILVQIQITEETESLDVCKQ